MILKRPIGTVKTAVVVLSLAALCLLNSCAASGRSASLDNARFYDAQGQFNAQAAKDAYFAFLAEKGYPVSENLRKNLFVSDFGLGRFTEAGLAAILWHNDPKNLYGALDAFLLPGQTIPEHWHEKTKDAPCKMESWHVRWGSAYAYGEGAPTAKIQAKLYPQEAPYLNVKRETVLRVGDVAGIGKPLEKHWMQAGPDGVIFTEYYTYHAGDGVKFTNPKVKF
jgi:D-lyxose ketol-isomerase